MNSPDSDPWELLDRVQGLARTGLHFTDWQYDRERYEALLDLATASYAELTGLPPGEVRSRFAAELGYITPKVGVAAAVFDDDDRILVVKRSDDGHWGLVSGWVEPGEHPSVAMLREAEEEVGCEVVAERLAVVHHRPANIGMGPHSVVSMVYLARLVSGEPGTSFEVDESGFHDIESVFDWHLDHDQLALAALRVRRGGEPETIVLPPPTL